MVPFAPISLILTQNQNIKHTSPSPLCLCCVHTYTHMCARTSHSVYTFPSLRVSWQRASSGERMHKELLWLLSLIRAVCFLTAACKEARLSLLQSLYTLALLHQLILARQSVSSYKMLKLNGTQYRKRKGDRGRVSCGREVYSTRVACAECLASSTAP